MKKGCFIAVGIVVVLLVAVVVIGGVFGGKYIMGFGNSALMYGVEEAIKQYKSDNPDAVIETNNKAWAAVLKDSKIEGQDLSEIIVDGKIIDIYKNPVKLEQREDGSIQVISSGKDGEFGTDDDASSAKLKELIEQK